MIMISPIPAFDDNYIWLVRNGDDPHVAVVDPGDAAPVIKRLQSEGLTLSAILITHHHGDHTGGVNELKQLTGCRVYGPQLERIPALDVALGEGDTVAFAGLEFSVLDTPGHTRGHLCYVGHGALFCGDTLFSAGCGRLFEGTAEQMYLSLEKIAALPDETEVYCAHEYTLANLSFAAIAEPDNPAIATQRERVEALRRQGLPSVPTTLAEEKTFNPFLHYHDQGLRAAAERFAARNIQPGADLFAVVRHWKDTLD